MRGQGSPYVLQRIIDRLAFRLAFVLLEVGLQLLLGLGRVQQKLLPRAKSQAADIAVRQARRLADESCDLQVALRHLVMMAKRWPPVKCAVRPVSVQFSFFLVSDKLVSSSI